MQNILVVLNSRAGTLRGRDAAEVKAGVHARLARAGRRVDIVWTKGAGIRDAIDRGVAREYDAIVVGGGDGSVSYAARHLAGSDKALGVLPLGTLNLLARDIGMPLDLNGALDALDHAAPELVDLGVLNGRPFHTLSGVGFFSQMARAREETRDIPGTIVRTAAAFMRALSRTGRFTLDIEADGVARQIDTFAALVTVNCFEGQEWRRPCLNAGMLEIHIAEDQGALAKFKAGADLVTGGWRDNPGIHSYRGRTVRLASARPRAWVSTDGELKRESVPLTYEVRPRALRLLVPP